MDLNDDEIIWIPTTGGEFAKPVEAGIDEASGQILYVGRGKFEDFVLPGKASESGKDGPGLYIAQGGKEHNIKNYDMLYSSKPLDWQAHSSGGVPLKPIQGGTDDVGNTLYVARARIPDSDGPLHLGWLNPVQRKCYFYFDGKEYKNTHYEVLAKKD